jgi:hypothetical protein
VVNTGCVMNDRIFWGVLAIFVVYLVMTRDNSTTAPQTNVTMKCEFGKPSPGRFFPTIGEVDLRAGPGMQYPKVVNVVGTKAFGSTQYRTAEKDEVLEGKCSTGEWLQAKVVEADGSPVDWETGWVPKKVLTTTMTGDHAAGLWWDVDEDTDVPSSIKKLAHDGALKVLKDNPNCGSINHGARDLKKKNSFSVDCNGHGGFSVQFAARDVSSGKSFAPPTPFPSDRANEMCQEAIYRASTHPSTVNLHMFGFVQGVDPGTSDRKILQEFDAKNGFGLELNYAASCVITPDGKISFGVSETR